MKTIPKVIENLREILLQEARKELFEEGYRALSIRQVAAKCGVAVGTLYNYFSSKEMLIATIVLKDWMKSLQTMNERTEEVASLIEGLKVIYEELLAFEALYHEIFRESTAVYSKYVSRQRHEKLRQQLEMPMKKICERVGQKVEPFTLSFIAENLLGASQEDIAFERLEGILCKILV